MSLRDKFIIAISGASGSIYGIRLLEALRNLNAETFLIISRTAQRVLEFETGFNPDEVINLATTHYDVEDLFAPIASGSNIVDIKAMIILPCSMKTLSAVANGYSDNLITRAADVVIKERKTLVLVPRETPFTAIHLKNMLVLAELGVVILPPIPSFYSKPQTLDHMIQQTTGRILDHLGVASDLTQRWRGET